MSVADLDAAAGVLRWLIGLAPHLRVVMLRGGLCP
jgi:hypothetical protein